MSDRPVRMEKASRNQTHASVYAMSKTTFFLVLLPSCLDQSLVNWPEKSHMLKPTQASPVATSLPFRSSFEVVLSFSLFRDFAR